jgi:hypothetical protein
LFTRRGDRKNPSSLRGGEDLAHGVSKKVQRIGEKSIKWIVVRATNSRAAEISCRLNYLTIPRYIRIGIGMQFS